MFLLHVWMTGSGTQFNMNVNEVISNRCCQIAGTPLGSKRPVHPNDDVTLAQSSNDSFPSAMSMAAAINVRQRLMPAVKALRDSMAAKSSAWMEIIAVQVMGNDVAAGFGGGGYLEMNVDKPAIIYNITHSITLMTDGCTNFRKFLVEGTKPNHKKIAEDVDRSLMLVATARAR